MALPECTALVFDQLVERVHETSFFYSWVKPVGKPRPPRQINKTIADIDIEPVPNLSLIPQGEPNTSMVEGFRSAVNISLAYFKFICKQGEKRIFCWRIPYEPIP